MCAFTCACVTLSSRVSWGLGSTARLSASPTEKDEFDIPDLTDNSRRQLFRAKSKRHFFFRVSEEQRQQRRRCACALRRRGGASPPKLGGGAKPGSARRGSVSGAGGASIPCAAPLPHTPSTRREMLKDPFVRSKLISPPTNFNHLVHVGPTDGKPSARVLPRVSSPEPIASLPGEAQPITGLPVALEPIAALCLPRTRDLSTSRLGAHCGGFALGWVAARSQPSCTVQQAPEGKGRGTRGSGPQRPHSFSEASRRPASVGSDGLAGDADTSKDNPTASTASVSLRKVSIPLWTPHI